MTDYILTYLCTNVTSYQMKSKYIIMQQVEIIHCFYNGSLHTTDPVIFFVMS